jgi:hypothetical protein
MKDLSWWDKFYTGLEKDLTKYTRPENWKERAMAAESNQRKPIRNQYEGRGHRE